MVNETYKTNLARGREFFEIYCKGKIIDIGGGNSPVTPNAEVFDLEQGDAQYISKYFEPESFDCVYSSHCLEHMDDVPFALEQWWNLVRPNGFMVIVIPDEDLYEQGIWPSELNSDHKSTFTVHKEVSWSPVSVNVRDLVSDLVGGELQEIELQDQGYDYNLMGKKVSPRRYSIWDYRKSKGIKKLAKMLVYSLLYYPWYVFSNCSNGRVIDQTSGDALAQIQFILRKSEY